MAIQTELEYTSTGVGPLPPQYASIAVGSPLLEYSHVNIGTTPEPEPTPLTSPPQQPTTVRQTTALEALQSPSPKPPAVPLAEIEPSMAEVTFPSSDCAVFFF